MNIIIIEDEAPAAKRIKKLAEEIDKDINVLSMLDSIETAVKWFATNPQPDLILMDIELADGQSFEIFNQVKITAPVIFTTAYDEFALKAFQVNSIDYLLKPIDKTALEKSITKLKSLKEQLFNDPKDYNIGALIKTLTLQQNYKSRFLVKIGEKFISIAQEQVAYFMSEDKISFLVTHDNKKYIIDQTLDEMENQLNPKEFFRINRQFIVFVKSIASINSYFNSKLKITLNPAAREEIIISREKAPLFKEWLNN